MRNAKTQRVVMRWRMIQEAPVEEVEEEEAEDLAEEEAIKRRLMPVQDLIK